ncbi:MULTISPECIES: EAL domain-containing protein [unclassified Acidovorax]|nr:MULTISPECIES: EAL domain-containing protein [unclassified Acidovorax]
MEHETEPYVRPDPLGVGAHWRILVVGDDPGVHAAMRAAVQGRTLFNRPLTLLQPVSGDEARALLMDQTDLALVILDLATEGAVAGCEAAVLEWVEFIRRGAGLAHTRIVVRAASGSAPNLQTRLRDDISDRLTEADIHPDRLLTTVVTTVRSYRQLCAAQASREGLELIVRSTAALLDAGDAPAFAAAVLALLARLLQVDANGLVCAQSQDGHGSYQVIAAAGRLAGRAGLPVHRLPPGAERELLAAALDQRCVVHGAGGGLALHIGGHDAQARHGERNGQDMAVFIDVPQGHGQLDAQLLDVLGAHLGTLLRSRRQLGRLHESAYHDPLVNLPNRAHFVQAVNACGGGGGGCDCGDFILALVDIDDFSATNEVMGHRFGDRLLEKVARCLEAAVPAGVLLARLGADTFGVLGPAHQVQPRRLLDCVRPPLAVDGVPHKVSLTCGYVRLPQQAQAGADLVKDATIALKRAKRDHRGQDLQYADQMGAEARARALLLSELRDAIEKRQLFLVYQPQLNLRTRSLVGLEALLRWRTADGRFVPPDQFIPVAEHSGIIVALGQWVLKTACATMRELIDLGLAPQRMAVNVSTVQLQDAGFLGLVRTALAASGLQGRQLELEITESVAALPTQLLEATLSALRAEGVSIAIDDFGTGYSSLSYLERLPLDRIKIDRSFVQQLGEPQGARIAEMVTQLGRNLGLSVLAEGIEDAAVWQALQHMGCQEGQGYHIARPMDRDALLAWLPQQQIQQQGQG